MDSHGQVLTLADSKKLRKYIRQVTVIFDEMIFKAGKSANFPLSVQRQLNAIATQECFQIVSTTIFSVFMATGGLAMSTAGDIQKLKKEIANLQGQILRVGDRDEIARLERMIEHRRKLLEVLGG